MILQNSYYELSKLYTKLGCKDPGTKNSEFVTKAQFLCIQNFIWMCPGSTNFFSFRSWLTRKISQHCRQSSTLAALSKNKAQQHFTLSTLAASTKNKAQQHFPISTLAASTKNKAQHFTLSTLAASSKNIAQQHFTHFVFNLCEETISRTDEGQPRPNYIFNKCWTNIYFFYSTEVWSITITEF